MFLRVCQLHFTGFQPPTPHPSQAFVSFSQFLPLARDSLLSAQGGDFCSVPLCLLAGGASASSIPLLTPTPPLLPPPLRSPAGAPVDGMRERQPCLGRGIKPRVPVSPPPNSCCGWGGWGMVGVVKCNLSLWRKRRARPGTRLHKGLTA